MGKNRIKRILWVQGCLVRVHWFLKNMASVFFIISTSVSASVTMTGTRIIYNEGSRSVDVHLQNKSSFPYVIQTWFDDGKMTTGPDNSVHVPFVATPPVFRIQPDAGQVIKVSFTGSRPPAQDRESVFYFNFLQVPPSNIAGGKAGANRMLVMLRNRVKLFYRPEHLSGGPGRPQSVLRVVPGTGGQSSSVTVTNSSPFHITISNIRLSDGKGKWSAKPDMLAPFSSRDFIFPGGHAVSGKTVTLTVINDQGARINEDYRL